MCLGPKSCQEHCHACQARTASQRGPNGEIVTHQPCPTVEGPDVHQGAQVYPQWRAHTCTHTHARTHTRGLAGEASASHTSRRQGPGLTEPLPLSQTEGLYARASESY